MLRRSCARPSPARIEHRRLPRSRDGVVAVVTGELLAQYNLAWMPTLSGDTQAVLATDKVRFQGQEVAAVVATDPYIAEDALEHIDVDYEILPAITSPQQSLADDAVLIRDDKEGQASNLVYEWESGDAAATEAASPRPTALCPQRRSIPARIRRRSRRAASSPTSTR
jgi:carbon-monoxide dehydrogenase large subunit